MNIDQFISDIVAQQFPSFYETDGPNLVAFILAYYEWMEQQGYTINASRNLMNYKDIDTTIDQFMSSFTYEFLQQFPAITFANKKFLIKHIKDFYKSKGSTQGLQLLFRLLFDDDINVYLPGKDILKASDGVWNVPEYIEVEHNPRTIAMIGQQIVGSKSGSTAFVENVHTIIIKSRIIDVLTLSSIEGSFLFGELVTENGSFADAPIITGSLTEISIVNGGANNNVGDIFNITYSDSGQYGSARVASVANNTGRVTFNLIDGGSGYTTNSSQVHVSNNVLTVNNVSGSYITFDTITQPLANVFILVSYPTNPNTVQLVGSNLYGYATNNSLIASGFVVATSGNNLAISVTNGNFGLSANIATYANSLVLDGFNFTNTTSQAVITGTNSTAIGIHNVINTFYGNGAYTVSNSGTTANSLVVGKGSGATFGIGTLYNTEQEFLYTDMISGVDSAQIPYLNMVISGGNSNVGLLTIAGSITTNSATNVVTGFGTTFIGNIIVGSGIYASNSSGNNYLGTVSSISNNTILNLSANSLANCVTTNFVYNIGQYGFPKNNSFGYNNIINDVLASNLYTIGTIGSLTGIAPGNNYTATPFVAVRDDPIAAAGRKNIILGITGLTGIIAVNDVVSSTFYIPTQTLAITGNTTSFKAANSTYIGEGVTQSNGTANSYGTIYTANSTYLVLQNIKGSFVSGYNVVGLTSNATASVSTATSLTSQTLAAGVVVSSNNAAIQVKRQTFNQSFVTGTTITSSSGGTATITSISQNQNSLDMGNNAIVVSNVFTATGIATSLQIIDSGYGHQPNNTIILQNNNNPYEIQGIANVNYQGIGLGYWKDTRGFLDSDKYIIDDTYYQDFSYEIRSKISMDKYADIVKQLAHVVGTKMFGSVSISSETTKPLIGYSSSIGFIYEQVVDRNSNQIIDRIGNIVLLRG